MDRTKDEIYAAIVKEFRQITGETWPSSGRCCRDVRDGMPECCYQIVDGADLTFTTAERSMIGWAGNVLDQREDGMWVLRRKFWDEAKIRTSLWLGTLADTLECASHPTRPIVDDETGRVTGVVLINGCNTLLALEQYQAASEKLLNLWREAVHLTGLKPYYARADRLKPDWKVL